MRILSIIKIFPMPGKRKELLDILHSVKGPTQAINGCLDCHICEENGDERTIVYFEHWQSWEVFIRHIRSALYDRVLGAMELSQKEPEVCFYEVATMKGIELIDAIRNPSQ
ncbi:MAG: Antibiotic biosynthesis monooxygenase [Geobacteraceae bacterium]|jgi:quinol monooxygenase YgiN|nr:Antibiotic biosynthesis monooxygenase [Geobacteraceae bacterium]